MDFNPVKCITKNKNLLKITGMAAYEMLIEGSSKKKLKNW